MRHSFFFFFLSLLLISCEKEIKNNIDVSHITAEFKTKRFEVDFYQSNSEGLEKLKKEYPVLFPKGVQDSVWINKINSKEEQELFGEVQKKYRDFSKTEKELLDLFKHIKYYDKNFESPDVITMTSNIDYEYRTIYSDSLVLISLDVYLGKNHPFYNDYPDYIKENNKQENIVVDVANSIIESQIIPSNNRSFLGKMIDAGKKLFLLDLYIPIKPDNIKMGYSESKLLWAEENEEQIWRYFIEENLLYSTDTKLNKRFLDKAPFSKFYLTEDSRSPGRVGQWIGWQIVRSFMQKNDVSLQALLIMNEEEIFKKSNYKPRK